MSEGELRVYSWEEIAKHTNDDDCWVVMYDKVLDVSKWLQEHPGGLDPIKDMAGMDITNSFESIGHSSTALVKSKSFIIGCVDPEESKMRKEAAKKASAPAPKWSETKREELRHYKGGEGIIPLPILVGVVVAILALLFYLLK
ncbi:putative cytochrome b5 [Leishmania mexicana MHOM/GT/2001/U1103]|uniref:Cytochrome b5 n=1 Tax=Leishmania mexicana (strain MHOM/GT/2001/U1103) TaxID=929439 RepID=E9ANK3_LEIMU|nr:putative cytochrome b5 [Leishmania mexicana MHOM/GT/2001/U1103]CBZ24514.1 putative cytochrome b5 [Leishmania mexicana MHOM/GT/2001/U1103]